MSDSITPQHLHLPSLSIAGFRGVEQLTIPRLGRVTLLAGRNGAGKTTVLDAVRVYAARGQPDALRELLVRREEFTTDYNEEGNPVDAPSFDALFHGRGDKPQVISIGPTNGNAQLEIRPSSAKNLKSEQRTLFEDMFSADMDAQVLKVSIENTEKILPMTFDPVDKHSAYIRSGMTRLGREGWTVPPIRCESLGPGLLSNRDLARFWDTVALTDDEPFALDALRPVFGDRVERATLVGEWRTPMRTSKLDGKPSPIG